MRNSVPQPPGPHPPVVRPAFVLRCQYCREPSRGAGRSHERVSEDRTRRTTYYRCWHCYTVDKDGEKRPSVFKVVRQVEETVRTMREHL